MKGAKGERILLVIFVVVSVSLLLFVSHVIAFLWSSPSPLAAPRRIEIPDGATMRRAAEILQREGLVTNDALFVLLGRWTRTHRNIMPGEYALNTRMLPMEILDRLLKGQVIEYDVAIPEGTTAEQISRLLEEQHLVDGPRFLALVRNPQFARALGIEADGLEGYLFPDTYRLTKRMGTEGIIRIMVGAFDRVYTPALDQRARDLGLTRHQVVTMASMIEKESGLDAERPLVSSAFHNRLRIGMPLQSDPTVIYALPRFTGPLRRTDLAIDSPYNTYRNRGLPPGPIASPGRASILAALEPARSPFLYFVSKNDGSHTFSVTLEQHNRAVARYRQRAIRQ